MITAVTLITFTMQNWDSIYFDALNMQNPDFHEIKGTLIDGTRYDIEVTAF